MNAIIPSQIKVSSVLNKDVTSYGKQHIFDGSKETCWNSDSGDNQFIKLKFDQTHKFKQICFTFQGGFSASQIDVLAKISDASVRSTTILYPTDTNDSQTFQVDLEGSFCIPAKYINSGLFVLTLHLRSYIFHGIPDRRMAQLTVASRLLPKPNNFDRNKTRNL